MVRIWPTSTPFSAAFHVNRAAEKGVEVGQKLSLSYTRVELHRTTQIGRSRKSNTLGVNHQ